MPNWCKNTLIIVGDPLDVEAFRERAEGRTGNRLDPFGPYRLASLLEFDAFVPKPTHIAQNDYDETAVAWEREHWGCKWGAVNPVLLAPNRCTLRYGFDTAWRQPDAFFRALVRLYPQLYFTLLSRSWESDLVWYVEGFAGQVREILDIQGNKRTRAWYREHDPQTIDEMFPA